MQILNTWPADSLLALPDEVRLSLINHLCEPFPSIDDAIAFWNDSDSLLIIFDHQVRIDALLSLLLDSLQLKVITALAYPEYTDELALGFTVKLSIFNDAGDGIYCVQQVVST